jgi:2'-5' RNA ligase
MRAFFCIPLEPDVAASIDRIARDVRDATDLRARWVRAENYHVTLRFLGDIDPLLTIDLERIARRVAGRLEPFTLTLDRLGSFPSVERARVLWIGGEAPPVFHGLISSLDHELRRLDFPPERKPSVAHVTLARIRGNPDPGFRCILEGTHPSFGLKVRADRIALMESVLAPTGASYTPLFTTRFRGRHDDGD